MKPFCITSEPVTIAAPAETVWIILTDFARYPDWNPFTRSVTGDLALGAKVTLEFASAKNPAKMQKFSHTIRALYPPLHLEWGGHMLHPRLFASTRNQYVVPLSAESCCYYTTDTFSGRLAGFIYRNMGDWAAGCFNDMARALKAAAEG